MSHHPILQPEHRYKERTAPLLNDVDDPSTYRDLLALASRLGLPVSIALEAYTLFKGARRKPRGLKAAAVLEAARRMTKRLITVEEVARAANVKPGQVYTALQALGVKHRWIPPEHYLISVVSKLKLAGEFRAKLVAEALNILSCRRVHGSPRTLAALALYAAAKRLRANLSMAEVAEAASVSKATIKRWKEILGGDRPKGPPRQRP